MTATAQRLESLRTVLHASAASLPAPTGNAGGNVSSALSDQRYFVISIDASATATLSDAQLCGRVAGVWRVVSILPAVISLTATLGFEFGVELVAGVEQLALMGTVSAGTVTVAMTPIEARA